MLYRIRKIIRIGNGEREGREMERERERESEKEGVQCKEDRNG